MKSLTLFVDGLKPSPHSEKDLPDARASESTSLQSFSSIRSSLRRSISTRSRLSLNADGLCQQCQQLDPQMAYDKVARNDSEPRYAQFNGFLIAEQSPDLMNSRCRLCQHFRGVAAATQLVAIPLLPVFMQLSHRAKEDLPRAPLDHPLSDRYVLACVPKGTFKERDLVTSVSSFILEPPSFGGKPRHAGQPLRWAQKKYPRDSIPLSRRIG